MSRRRLAALVLLAAGPAAAQASPDRPTPQERAWLQACVEATSPDAPRTAFDRCAGRLTGACLGSEDPDTPALAQPPGRNSHPRSCAPIETALWDEAMNRWYRAALAAIPAEAQEALRRAQRAWIGFRDLACVPDALASPGFLGGDNAAACRLELVASRALELRRLAAPAP
jgi:uncharacterized protein YecT (DUF1311 family)